MKNHFLNFSEQNLPSDEKQDSLLSHILRGEVESVLYSSSDGEYSVIRIRDFQGIDHVAVGALSGAYPGECIEIHGKWEVHPEHGRQMRAEQVEYKLPATEQGIIRYLSSGIIRGIGPKVAKKIVDTFGLETIEILDKSSRRLKEVAGLGEKRISQICSDWKKNSERRNLQIYLQGLGITPSYFARIYNAYGDKCADVVKTNPYQLSMDVRGIGFLMQDHIAANLGIEKNSMQRMLAGIKYNIEQIRMAGHVCVPKDSFADQTAQMLEVPFEDIVAAIDSAEQQKIIYESFSPDGTAYLYEPKMLLAENELPKLILSLLNRKNHYGRLLLACTKDADAKLSDEQIAAVENACKYAVSIITGGPGVGKTTVISEIVRRAKQAKRKFVLAAPTGRAAKRMTETTGEEAKTIHRLLKWDPVKNNFVFDKNNKLSDQIYIIDESSMLDLPLTLSLFRAIPDGSCVIIVGDPDQLPSVGPGNVLNDLIDSNICPVSRLTKIFRQGEGSGIILAAHQVNKGEIPSADTPQKETLHDFYWIQKENAEDVADLIERIVCERIPKRFHMNPLNDIQVLCPMNRGSAGTVSMNERLQNVLNPEKEVYFRKGNTLFKRNDKVMQICNNYDKNVFNGDMGIISEIDVESKSFSVQYEQNIVDYSFDESDQLALAYAVTVHKSQGSEFPAVVMPLLLQHYNMLQRNLLYTGITRAKKLMILIGPRKAVEMAVRNVVREPRYSMLYDKLKNIMEKERTYEIRKK